MNSLFEVQVWNAQTSDLEPLSPVEMLAEKRFGLFAEGEEHGFETRPAIWMATLESEQGLTFWQAWALIGCPDSFMLIGGNGYFHCYMKQDHFYEAVLRFNEAVGKGVSVSISNRYPITLFVHIDGRHPIRMFFRYNGETFIPQELKVFLPTGYERSLSELWKRFF